MTPTPKSEALRALAHITQRLASPEALDGFARRQLADAIGYVTEQVTAIHEVQRVRKPRAVAVCEARSVVGPADTGDGGQG